MLMRGSLIGLLCSLEVLAATPHHAETEIVPVQVFTARQLTTLREDQIDLALVGLTLSSLFDASTDVAAGVALVDCGRRGSRR